MNMKQARGFTIVELLIVCAVVAILAAITLAFTSPSRTKARDNRRLSDMTQIQAALESYFAEQPRTDAQYPDDLDDLAPDHIAMLPEDPSSDNPDYYYERSATGKGYCLAANFEDSPQLERTDATCAADSDFSGYNYIIRR